MHRFRPLIFWLFTGLFFVTTTLIVFYAFGYRFNFERGIFIYTGSISIKSNPEAVSVRIDDQLIAEQNLGILNNSILISGLAPGRHSLEVSAPGYRPWSKKAIVQSGFSTEFWNVLLVKEDPAPTEIPTVTPARKMFPAPDENLFAVAQTQNDSLAVMTLNSDNFASEPVFSLAGATLPSDGENIEWSPDNRKLIIPLEQDGTRSYSVVDIEEKAAVSLQPFTPTELSLANARWDSTARNFLLYLKGSVLYRANTEALTDTPLFLKENILAYDISGNSIYYLSADNGIVYRMPLSGITEEPTQVTTAPIDIDPADTYALVVYNENRIALRARNLGKLWIYNKLLTGEAILKPLADRGVQGVQFSNDGKKLLFFTDNEIAVYFTTVWEAQPLREEDTTLQIARFSNLIKNVQWTKDYEHVMFTTNGSAKIIELDNRDHRNIAEVAAFPSPIIQVLSRFESNQVYFILESGTLSFIEFPTPQDNLFGF